jgi:hypothetical protein
MEMFTFFNTQESTKPQARDWVWTDFVADVMAGHKVMQVNQKPYTWHFNASTYKKGGRRQAQDIEFVNAVILDYDDYVQFKQTIALYEHLKHLEFVAYTSFNHQRAKDETDHPRDKFRIIFPFKNPCPASVYKEIAEYLQTTFAPKADRCVGNPNQIYTYVACPPETEDLAETHYSNGDFLDWETMPRVKQIVSIGGMYPVKEPDHLLPADHVFKLRKGSIRFGDVDKHVQGVYCPHHEDKSPGGFLNKKGKTIYHVCSKCGTTKILFEKAQPEPSIDEAVEQLATRSADPLDMTEIGIEDIKKSQLLVFDDEPAEPFSRERRVKLIQKLCMKKKHEFMLLEAFEGFGKSHYAVLEAQRGSKILFASTSNEQAAEQAESFRNAGLDVQLVPGREYILRTKYKVQVESYPQSHPWDGENIDEKKTKQWMIDNQKLTEKEVNDIWDACSPPEPDFVSNSIVCTTIARTMAYGRIQRNRASFVPSRGLFLAAIDRLVPADAIVFFDDADKKHYTKYEPYDQSFIDRQQRRKNDKKQRDKVKGKPVFEFPEGEEPTHFPLSIDNVPVKEVDINGRRYFVRPNNFKLGYGLFDTRIVFTTTEMLTTKLIESMYPNVYKPKLMPDERMLAGDITMIKTNFTSSKRDGLLPPIVKRLQKEGFDFDYIADGQGSRFNLTNSKGQNVLGDSNTVIEISEPHMSDVTRFIDELHWTESDRHIMKIALAVDSLQQAIGRNSGYRWSDRDRAERKACVVLCEPKLFDRLIKTMRYHVETIVTKPETRASLKRGYTTITDALCWYITYVDRYICQGLGQDKEAFWNDVEAVLAESQDQRRAIRFKKRLVDALGEKIKGVKNAQDPLVLRCQKYVKKLGY